MCATVDLNGAGRFWARAVDLGVPVTVHVQFGLPSNTYGGSSGPAFLYARQP